MCRSGRTGRANGTGVSITLVDRRKEGLIPFIEKRAGLKFERIGAPQPKDIVRVAGACLTASAGTDLCHPQIRVASSEHWCLDAVSVHAVRTHARAHKKDPCSLDIAQMV